MWFTIWCRRCGRETFPRLTLAEAIEVWNAMNREAVGRGK